MKQYFTHKWLTTAISFTLLIGSVVTPAHGSTHRNKPTRDQILTALWLMSHNYTEYLCAKEIIRKESNYNINAKNGSHYGLAQGRSLYLKSASYTEQLAWFYRYTRSRYGEACKALEHHKKHNWY